MWSSQQVENQRFNPEIIFQFTSSLWTVCWLKLAESTCIKHNIDNSLYHNLKLKIKANNHRLNQTIVTPYWYSQLQLLQTRYSKINIRITHKLFQTSYFRQLCTQAFSHEHNIIPTLQTRHIFLQNNTKNKINQQKKIVIQTKHLIVLSIYAIATLSKSGSNWFPIEAGHGKQSPQWASIQSIHYNEYF